MEYIIGAVIGLLVGAVLVYVFGVLRERKQAEEDLNSARNQAKQIVNEAYKSAENKKREAMVEAKEEILKARNEYEQEEKERRADLQKQERRLQQKEENLDRKTENMEKKEEHLSNRLAKLEATQAEAEQLKQEQVAKLEEISGFTAEEAKAYLLDQLEADVTHESAMKIKEIEARFKDEADTKAREIISLAIQRCAADHVAEATVSVVPLPNDEMKGRIIGREGRNIRTLETLTGVDLIIDDTPEAITVSCFDPVRREIARLALEKLILDGRIHPARIEEMVEKAKREVDATIKAEGERAIFETNVHGLHPELVKLLGRRPSGPDCSTTWASPSTTRWRAPTSPSAWSWPGSTTRARPSSTPSTPTTTTWSPRRWWPAWFRRPTPSPPPGPAPGGRTWRTISSVWRSWRRSPPPSPAWRSPSPSRRAGRSASWSSPTRSARTRWCSWPGRSPRRSRTSWNTPARSRSTSCGRPKLSSTRSNIPQQKYVFKSPEKQNALPGFSFPCLTGTTCFFFRAHHGPAAPLSSSAPRMAWQCSRAAWSSCVSAAVRGRPSTAWSARAWWMFTRYRCCPAGCPFRWTM